LHGIVLTAHYACETTVFFNGKYNNTTYISKIRPEQKKNRFSIKMPEHQIKQKKNRPSEKNSSGNTGSNIQQNASIVT